MFDCKICQKCFDSKRSLDSHVAGKHARSNTGKNTNRFQLYCSCISCKKSMTAQTLDRHFISAHVTHHEVPKKYCPRCGASHHKNGIYCSRICANGRPHSEDTKKKISKSVIATSFHNKKHNGVPPYCRISICRQCNRYFELSKNSNRKSCSEACKHELISAGGRKSVTKQSRRSKDEVALYELCSGHFNHVEHNIPMFNGWDADILIHDFHIAIMWNGPWHYRDMNFGNHSLSQVQTRDRIKIDVIKSFGWKVLVFEDRSFSPETAFSNIVAETGFEPSVISGV